MLHPQPVSLNCRQSVHVVEGALGFWSSSNTAPMMTPLDFETSAENAQRWLAGLRPKNTSGGWSAGLVASCCAAVASMASELIVRLQADIPVEWQQQMTGPQDASQGLKDM